MTEEIEKTEAKPKEVVLPKKPAGKIEILLDNISSPVVTFKGDYITKRDLEIIIRALKRAHRNVIREYRKQRIIAEYKENVK